MAPRPTPSAPTHRHGTAMLIAAATIVLLLTLLMNITYALEAVDAIEDALGV